MMDKNAAEERRWRPIVGRAVVWMAVGALALYVALLLAGCGASAIQSHARAATIVGVTLGETRDVLVAVRRADLDAVEHATEAEGAEATLAAVEARRTAWTPAFQALEDARLLVASWIDAIALAVAAGGGEDLLAPVLRLAARAVWLYVAALDTVDALAGALHIEGVGELPRLPEWVVAMAGLLAPEVSP